MAVWALGINHTTAPLDLRGRFAFALDQIAPTLQGLRQSLSQNAAACGAVETAIISTCNRTEIYCAGERPALDHTLGWLAHAASSAQGTPWSVGAVSTRAWGSGSASVARLETRSLDTIGAAPWRSRPMARMNRLTA